MEITVTVPPNVEEHLRTYAASLFFETSPYAISRAVLTALINELDAAHVVNRDKIVQGILAVSKPLTPESAPVPESAPIVEKERPAEAVPAPQKLAPAAIEPFTDPKQLKVPGEQFQQKESNTWLVWGWCMASSLNPISPDSGWFA